MTSVLKLKGAFYLRNNTMPKKYYDPSDLKKFGNITEFQPEMGNKFFDWYGSVFEEGALTAREKSLIALAVAHAVQCPYCIDAYTDTCMKKGADEEQMMEAVHVAAAIKGGAVLVHGVQMMNQVKEKLM
tara:strand:- start:366 stop:752 length:387 start_codon:yes stop_codon:yes gene_type:complete